MNFKKTIVTTLIAASGFGISIANAGVVNVGGIKWNTDSPLDFDSTSATIRQSINPVTGEVSGFGVITTINGTGVGAFLAGATELTFTFDGFIPVGGAATPTPADPTGSQIFYAGGSIKVFADQDLTDNADPFNPLSLTAANTGDGLLWLDMVGHEINGSSLTGTNNAQGGLGTLSGVGQADVIGGAAFANFDTNTKIGGSDFTFTNSFSSFIGGNILESNGAGTFKSDSVAIPEPTTLALLGLGLLGFSSTRKLKK